MEGKDLIYNQKDGSAVTKDSLHWYYYRSADSVVLEAERELENGRIDEEWAGAIITRYSGKMTTFCPMLALVEPEKRLSPLRYVLTREGAVPEVRVAIEKVCAWPNLTLLPDGTIAAMIFNQPSHGQMPGDVACWASEDGGLTWKRRGVPAPRDSETSNRMNHAAGLDNDGNLIVICSGWSTPANAAKERGGYGELMPTLVSRSKDGGRTWSVARGAFAQSPDGEEVVPFGDIMPGKDGALLAAAYSRSNKTYVFRSRDNGKTWGEPTWIAAEAESKNMRWNDRPLKLRSNETALLHLGGGKWLAAARYNGILLFASEDDGRTWTYRRYPERGNAYDRLTAQVQHPGHLLRLADGTVMLTYGNRNQENGVREHFVGRMGVDVIFSDDEGRSWSRPFRIADVGGDVGYPSSVQRADGQVVTAYYATSIGDRRRKTYAGYHMGVVIWDPVATRQASETRRGQ